MSSLFRKHIYTPILFDYWWGDTCEGTEISEARGKVTCLQALSQLGSLTHSSPVPAPAMEMHLRQSKGPLSISTQHTSFVGLFTPRETPGGYTKPSNVVRRHLGAIVNEFLVIKHPLMKTSLISEVIMTDAFRLYSLGPILETEECPQSGVQQHRQQRRWAGTPGSWRRSCHNF